MAQPLNLHEMIERLYGVRTTEAEHTGTSGTAGAAAQIVPNNPRRLSLVIVNLSVNVMFIGLKNTVTATNGIWLQANGGSVTLTWDKDFASVTRDWYVISAAGGDAYYAQEVLSQ